MNIDKLKFLISKELNLYPEGILFDTDLLNYLLNLPILFKIQNYVGISMLVKFNEYIIKFVYNENKIISPIYINQYHQKGDKFEFEFDTHTEFLECLNVKYFTEYISLEFKDYLVTDFYNGNFRFFHKFIKIKSIKKI